MRIILPISFLLLGTACEARPPIAKPQPIPRVWTSSGTTYAETDSLAACKVGNEVHLFATAKHGHRLDIFDAATGKFIKSIGSEGDKPGQFRRPNGIITVDVAPGKPMIFVIERDNARVQVIDPVSLKSVGMIGEGILTRPYGAAVAYAADKILLYVTEEKIKDNKCVRVFRIEPQKDEYRGAYQGAFGDASGPGAIHKPESIVFDPVAKVLLICDEEKHQKNVKVYTPDGKFTGKIFAEGYVTGDPEGIVVVDGANGGFVILTDQQKDITLWHLFRRGTYEYLTTVRGEPSIANTDGICLFTDRFGPFESGALFAVNNDADSCAFQLKDFSGFAAPNNGK